MRILFLSACGVYVFFLQGELSRERSPFREAGTYPFDHTLFDSFFSRFTSFHGSHVNSILRDSWRLLVQLPAYTLELPPIQ